jgi:hypothetical protein
LNPESNSAGQANWAHSDAAAVSASGRLRIKGDELNIQKKSAKIIGIVMLSVSTMAALSCGAQARVNLLGDIATLEWGGVLSGPWTLGSLSPDMTGSSVDIFGPVRIGAITPTFSGSYPSLGVDVNVGRNTVTVTENPADESTSFYADLSFNGFVLRDLTRAFSVASLQSSSVPSFAASDIAVVRGDLWVNFAGLAILSGEHVVINLEGRSAVPEPPTWAMTLLGFAGLGFAGYRQMKKRSCHRLSLSLKPESV